MKRIGVVALWLTAFFLSQGLFFHCLAQQDYQGIKIPARVIAGKVLEVNFVSSKITVEGSDLAQKDGEKEKFIFAIDEKTKVLKSGYAVSASDIMAGDEVLVEYFDDPQARGQLKANRIEFIASPKQSSY